MTNSSPWLYKPWPIEIDGLPGFTYRKWWFSMAMSVITRWYHAHMRTMVLEYAHQHLPLPKITQFCRWIYQHHGSHMGYIYITGIPTFRLYRKGKWKEIRISLGYIMIYIWYIWYTNSSKTTWCCGVAGLKIVDFVILSPTHGHSSHGRTQWWSVYRQNNMLG